MLASNDHRSLGFLAKKEHRNVLLTRQEKRLFVIEDENCGGSDFAAALAEDIEDSKVEQSLKLNEVDSVSPYRISLAFRSRPKI